MNSDGTGLRYLEFDVPNQASWQPGGFFADGQRVLLLSMEPRRDGPGRPFSGIILRLRPIYGFTTWIPARWRKLPHVNG